MDVNESQTKGTEIVPWNFEDSKKKIENLPKGRKKNIKKEGECCIFPVAPLSLWGLFKELMRGSLPQLYKHKSKREQAQRKSRGLYPSKISPGS